jgi:hypothetical protein|tara:strand:- start:14662 stop:14985 length:324 start_codon:yes stop_codon:yes gene_type:complete
MLGKVLKVIISILSLTSIANYVILVSMINDNLLREEGKGMDTDSIRATEINWQGFWLCKSCFAEVEKKARAEKFRQFWVGQRFSIEFIAGCKNLRCERCKDFFIEEG